MKYRVLAATAAWLVVAGCGDDTAAEHLELARLSDGCLINSDCTAPLVCAFKRCHKECEDTRDCDAPLRCMVSDRPFNVCQLSDETGCSYNSQCPTGQLCAVDGQCRDQCQGSRDCIVGQSCTSGTCAEPAELVDGGLVPTPGNEDAGAGTPCIYNSDCPGDLVCLAGQCRPECLRDRDCRTSERCASGRCVLEGGSGGTTGTGGTGGSTSTGGTGGATGGAAGSTGSGGTSGSTSSGGSGGTTSTGGAGGATGGAAGSTSSGGNAGATSTGGSSGSTSSGGSGGTTTGGSGGTSSGGSGGTSTWPAPLAYYPLDNAGSGLRDVLASSHGLIFGVPASVPGKRGQALSFDRVDDRVALVRGTTLGAPTGFTIGVWMKPTLNMVTGSSLLLFRDSDYSLRVVNSGINFDVGGAPGGQLIKTTTLSAGVWHHVVGVFDPLNTTETMRLYLDGARVGELASSTLAPGLALDAGLAGSFVNSELFLGALDEAFVSNSPFTDSQVQALYTTTSGGGASNSCATCPAISSYWPMDDAPSNTLSDAAGTNPGTITAGASLTAQGRVGTAIQSFTTNYPWGVGTNVPTSPTLAHGAPFSIAIWARSATQVTSGSPVFVDHRLAAVGYSLGYDVDRPYFVVNNVVLKPGAPQVLSANTWYHLAGTYDGTTARFYVDGAEVDVQPATGDVATTAPLTFGNESSCCRAAFAGALDEAVLYDVLLSGAQVASLYQRGLAGTPAYP